MIIQSILFRKSIYHTRATAMRWLRIHKYKTSINPDPNPDSKNWHRFRQVQVNEFQPDSFRIYKYNDSIHFVIGKLKKVTEER